MKEMQAYMNPQACFAYGGPPSKTPPATFAQDVLGIKDDPSAKSRLVSRGVDAQTQTSYEQTRFPIRLAALKQFNESSYDIKTVYGQSDVEEMIFDDP